MVGIVEVRAGISSLKAAFDIAKGLQALDTDAKVKLATMDLMEKILSAQQDAFAAQEEQAALLQRIRALEAQVAKAKAWDTEKKRYQLEEFPTGVFAYSLKTDTANGEPTHRICPACYQDSHKSILQVVGKVRGGEVVDCPRCKVRLELVKAGPVQVRHSPGSDYF